jgi:hypothetical protein
MKLIVILPGFAGLIVALLNPLDDGTRQWGQG